MVKHLLVLAGILGGWAFAQNSAPGAELSPATVRVYIGTYASADVDGIHVCQLDLSSGQLTRQSGISGIANPSFLALHPSSKYLYAVGESQHFRGTASGSVSAFAIDRASGDLTLLNHQSSQGKGPCHLAVDRTGKHVVVANYSGGSVTVLPLQQDGNLLPASDHVQHEGSSVNPRRQQGPHAHSINFDPRGQFVMSCDLGLDKVMIYRFDRSQGKLLENAAMPAAVTQPGAGPRHLAFHPTGRFAYVINELNSTVTAFQYDPQRGVLQSLASYSTLPDGFDGQNSTAEIDISADGRFLYGSNRGHNSIAVFAVDQQAGTLNRVANHSTLGEVPRNFALDPTSAYLLAANQDSDNVVVFRRDPETGKLTATGHQLQVPRPVCVTMVSP